MYGNYESLHYNSTESAAVLVVSNSAQRNFCEVYRTFFMMENVHYKRATITHSLYIANCTQFTKPYVIVKMELYSYGLYGRSMHGWF